jgi:DNA-binding MarR family transcriptional regulator
VDSDDAFDRALEQWGRERPDLDVEALVLVGRLLRAARLAEARLGEGLRAHGLERGWFDLLAPLRRAGEPYELNPTHLMRATMLSSGGMTKRLDRLADTDLIERRPDPNDRRGTLVRLTPRGKAVVDAALVDHLANEEEILTPLTPEERESLDRILRKLLAQLGFR